LISDFREQRWPRAWGVTTLASGRVISSPAVANGLIYVGSTDGYLYALQ